MALFVLVVCRRRGAHHRVVLPCENGQAVLVLAELLLDLGPHAFGLALQRDEDDGMPTQLNQVQEALSAQAHKHIGSQQHMMATLTSCGGAQ